MISAGPWLSTPGLFFAGWGRVVAEADLPDTAAEEVGAADGWVKLRGDWIVDEQTHAAAALLPPDVLAATVRRVHEAGGRVAIHAIHAAMHAQACRWAVGVGVGVDSLEHGLWLDHNPAAEDGGSGHGAGLPPGWRSARHAGPHARSSACLGLTRAHPPTSWCTTATHLPT